MMLSAIGLDHKTAPLDVRERVAIAEPDLPGVLPALRALPAVSEAVLLSTCNRTEAYLVSGIVPALASVAGELAHCRALDASACLPWMSLRRGDEAAGHLLRVVAGLESMVVGEHQILGQVRRAFEAARTAGTIGPVLNRLFQLAVATGRRVRRETGLSSQASSVPRAAAALCRRALGGLRGRRVLVVGAGEMAGLVVKAFAANGAAIAAIANRTLEAARLLAAHHGAVPVSLEAVRTWSEVVDTVVVTVGAPEPVLTAADFPAAYDQRVPLLVVDIGVPRGVDPSATAAGVHLYNLDDLGGAARTIPHEVIERAEVMTTAAGDVFRRWWLARRAAPVIAALQRRVDEITAAELGRARLRDLDARQRDAVQAAVRGALAKLLHTPMVRLKTTAFDGSMVSLAQELFDLDGREE